MHCDFVEILLVCLGTWVATCPESSVNTGCSAIPGIVGMGNAGDWSHSDVLVDEVFCCEVIESFCKISFVANALIILALLESTQFSVDEAIHDIEDGWHIGRLFLESSVFGENSKLCVDASSPLRDLIIHDIDSLESLLQLGLLVLYLA